MAAPFTIDDFKAKVDGLGSFIRKNRYTVQIVPPSNMHVPVNIEFLVKQVSFPEPKKIISPFEGGARETLKCIQTGKDGVSNGTDGLKTLDLIFGIYQSAQLKGKKINIK